MAQAPLDRPTDAPPRAHSAGVASSVLGGTGPVLEPLDVEGDRPRHVAIIMDGNRRWARAQGLTEIEGHAAGVEAVALLPDPVGELLEETSIESVCDRFLGWVERIDDAHHFVILDFLVTVLDPDVVVEDNVNCFPALLTCGAPWVRIVSCNPLEVKDPSLPPPYSGYAIADRTGWDAFRAEYGPALADEVALPLLEAWSGLPADELSAGVLDKIPAGAEEESRGSEDSGPTRTVGQGGTA